MFSRRGRVVFFVLVGCVSAPTLGCKPRKQSHVQSLGEEAKDSLAIKLQSEKADLSALPVILPSLVWKKMSAEERVALIHLIVGGVLPKGIDSKLQALLMTNFNIPADQPLPVDSAQANEQISQLIYQKIDENPKLLDYLPAIELEKIPFLQSEFAKRAEPPNVPDDLKAAAFPKPAVPDAGIRLRAGKAKDCSPPTESPVEISGRLVQTKIAIDKAVPCFHENSADLANAFNWLSRTLTDQPRKVNFDLRIERGRKINIESTQEFLSALHQAGFTIEIFSTRYIVEFKQIAFKDTDGLKSIRLPTWMIAPRQDGLRAMVAEHGEVEVLIHKDGERYAQVRWYAGLPIPGFEHYPAQWRVHSEKSSDWQQPIHEFVEVYKSSEPEKLEQALHWFKATSRLMKAFNVISQIYGLRLESYGQVVCTDSLIFAVQMVAEQRLRKSDPVPVTKAFPVFRSEVRPQPDSLPLSILFSELAGINNSELEDNYPQDYRVVKTDSKYKVRLAEAYPPEEAWRFKHFPELQAEAGSEPIGVPEALQNLAPGDSCSNHNANQDCSRYRGCGWSRPIGKEAKCISITSRNCADYSEDKKWCEASFDKNYKLCVYVNGQCQSNL